MNLAGIILPCLREFWLVVSEYPTFCRRIWKVLSYLPSQDFDRYYPTLCLRSLTGIILPSVVGFRLVLSYLLSQDFDRYYPTFCRTILTGIILPSVAGFWQALSYLLSQVIDRFYPTFCRRISTGIILPSVAGFWLVLSYLLSQDFDRYYPTFCRRFSTSGSFLPGPGPAPLWIGRSSRCNGGTCIGSPGCLLILTAGVEIKLLIVFTLPGRRDLEHGICLLFLLLLLLLLVMEKF